MLSNPQRSSPQNPFGDFVVLGIIVRPHGLKGEVKVQLTCSGIDRLKNCPTLRLVRNNEELKKVSVQRVFLHNDGDAVVRLREVQGVEEAESLRGAALAVAATDKETPAAGTYYLDDLVGLRVEKMDGQAVGVIEEILEMPANSVCVTRGVDGAEILVPFSKSVVREVDLKARLMRVDLPEEIDGDAAD